MHHNYNEEEKLLILNWLTLSFQRLIERDHELLHPESVESDFILLGEKELNREVHETTINHRLAVNMEMYIPANLNQYHVDIEYNRYINQRKLVQSLQTGERIEVRPDILVHSRTNLRIDIPHFLVVEAKKYSTIEKDRNHVMDIMADHNYQYKYGILVSYYQNVNLIQCELFSFENGQFVIKAFEIRK